MKRAGSVATQNSLRVMQVATRHVSKSTRLSVNVQARTKKHGDRSQGKLQIPVRAVGLLSCHFPMMASINAWGVDADRLGVSDARQEQQKQDRSYH